MQYVYFDLPCPKVVTLSDKYWPNVTLRQGQQKQKWNKPEFSLLQTWPDTMGGAYRLRRHWLANSIFCHGWGMIL